MEGYFQGLNPFQRTVLEQYKLPRLFAVISWGASATSWLAYALNSIPNVYCVHAANYFWKRLGNCAGLDGVEYMRIIGAEGNAHALSGDVHGVSREQVPAMRQAFGERLRVAVLVREPLARLKSQFALFDQLAQFESHKPWDISYTHDLVAKLGLNLPNKHYATFLRVHGINMLNAIIAETEIGPIWRSEDLTHDPAKFSELVSHLSAGTIALTGLEAQSIVGLGIRNVHAGAMHKELNQWEYDLLSRIVEPRAWDLYRGLGYECP